MFVIEPSNPPLLACKVKVPPVPLVSKNVYVPLVVTCVVVPLLPNKILKAPEFTIILYCTLNNFEIGTTLFCEHIFVLAVTLSQINLFSPILVFDSKFQFCPTSLTLIFVIEPLNKP